MSSDLGVQLPINKKRLLLVAKLLKKRSIKCLNKNYANNAKVNSDSTKMRPVSSISDYTEKNYVESLNSQESRGEEDCKDATAEEFPQEYQSATTNHVEKKNNETVSTKTADLGTLTAELESNYNAHDKLLQGFTESAFSDDVKASENVQNVMQQLLNDINTLDGLLKEKENEWNKLLHMRTVKQELLMRIQRKKYVKYNCDGFSNKNFGNLENNLSSLSANLTNSNDYLTSGSGGSGGEDKEVSYLNVNASKHASMFNNNGDSMKLSSSLLTSKKEFNGFSSGNECRTGRQGPIIDVRSIIADYRQTHPDVVPRRGRRMKSATRILQKEDSPSLLNNPILSSSVSCNLSTTSEPSLYSNVLTQLKELSQHDGSIASSINKMQLPHPEVSMHPVQNQSLLHATLKKAQTKLDSKPAFSPTLAKLLTAPKRSATAPVSITTTQPTNDIDVSIADLLANRKEDQQDHEDSVDRLVIDEENSNPEPENLFSGNDGTIKCQGCNQKSAKFVCAGCGNQWYCSRECQISAWDDHSDVCSG